MATITIDNNAMRPRVRQITAALEKSAGVEKNILQY